MGYVHFGRKLGRGTRQVTEHLRGRVHEAAREKAPEYLAQGRVVATQGKRAGRSFGKRLAHAGRTLWHEVMGVFFAFFALFFIQGMWRARADYRQGPEHPHFLLFLALTILFVYFSISSFVRSRQKPS